jgi:hypothetical protein
MYLALPVRNEKRVLTVVRLSLPLQVVNRRLRFVTRSLLTVIGITGVLALLLNLGVVNYLVGPVRQMSRAARRIAGGT